MLFIYVPMYQSTYAFVFALRLGRGLYSCQNHITNIFLLTPYMADPSPSPPLVS